MTDVSPEDVLAFWFYEVGPLRWFDDDLALDEEVRTQFGEAYEAAVRGELQKYEETPEGVLMLLILLDHFPRRLFRNTPRAYENDDLTVDMARQGIIKHFDDRIDKSYKLIFYLPFQHSEHLGDQRLALFYIRERTKDDLWIEQAEASVDIVQRFGRFPERNAVLGRESTEEEIFYLAQKGLPT